MKTITVCQRKGDNGKSTSALNLAHAFALSGKKILLIDLDEQKNTTSAISTLTKSVHTIESLLVDSSVTLAEAATATTWDGVSLIAASESLSGTIRILDSMEEQCFDNCFSVILNGKGRSILSDLYLFEQLLFS